MVDQAQNGHTAKLDCTNKYIVVVSGASRGIGHEFVRQLCQSPDTLVIALVRKTSDQTPLQQLNQQHHNIHTVVCHLDDPHTIDTACQQIHTLVPHINLLVNCGGYAGVRNYEDQPLTIDRDDMLTVFKINTVAQLHLIQALHPLLAAVHTTQPKAQPTMPSHAYGVVLNISSRNASPAHAITFGGCASYRVSKVGLNMVTATLAYECKQCIYISCSPGHVQTDMGRLSGRQPALSSEDSVGGMLKVVNKLTSDDSGKFYNYDGNLLPY